MPGQREKHGGVKPAAMRCGKPFLGQSPAADLGTQTRLPLPRGRDLCWPGTGREIMTPEQRKSIEHLGDTRWVLNSQAEAIKACLEAADTGLRHCPSSPRGVGPFHLLDGAGEFCPNCLETCSLAEQLHHRGRLPLARGRVLCSYGKAVVNPEQLIRKSKCKTSAAARRHAIAPAVCGAWRAAISPRRTTAGRRRDCRQYPRGSPKNRSNRRGWISTYPMIRS